MRAARALSVAILLAGCLGEKNPCPIGQRPNLETDRCVPDSSGATASVCSAEDVARWTEPFSRPGLVRLTQGCAISCGGVPPCIADCVVDAVGASDCPQCVRASIECATLPCAGACARGTDAECRACQCDAACVLAFGECAGVQLEPELCDGVHGRPAEPGELDLPFPIVLRRKSATGFTRATAFIPEAPAEQEPVESYAAAGWTDFLTFSLGGVDYVLEVMGACERARCPVRVSPVLFDGSFATPAWRSQWDLGWDVLTTFEADGDTYVLLHKTGAIPVTGEPRGTVRAYRFQVREAGQLDVGLVHQDTWAFATQPAWSHVRGFAIAGVPHLLRYRSGPEASAEVLRVIVAGGGLAFARVSRELGWAAGWDIVETFSLGERWFVLQYAAGGDGPHPAGSARISALLPEEGGAVIVSPPLASATWPTGLDGVVPFRTAGGVTHLVRHEQERGRAEIVAIAPDIATWRSGGLRMVHAETWGVNPPWDVLAVARADLWSAR